MGLLDLTLCGRGGEGFLCVTASDAREGGNPKDLDPGLMCGMSGYDDRLIEEVIDMSFRASTATPITRNNLVAALDEDHNTLARSNRQDVNNTPLRRAGRAPHLF